MDINFLSFRFCEFLVYLHDFLNFGRVELAYTHSYL